MKKVLITGGAGFIGSEIVTQLSKAGSWDITVLDAMTRQIHGENWEESYLFRRVRDKCRFIRGDIREYAAVYEAMGDAECVIHLAAETGTGQSMYQVNRYNEVNIMGTSNIFQAITNIKTKKVRKIILPSSRSVYGEGKYVCPACGVVYPTPRSRERMSAGDFALYCAGCGKKIRPVPTTEDSPIRPNSLYAFTKYAQEKMVETMCPALGLDYAIFRFQNVYGVGQSLKNPYTGILSIFSALLLENKKINIFEDGEESRDFINVIDAARGVIASLDRPQSNSEIINLGSGVGISVMEVARLLKQIYHSSSDIEITGDYRIGDIAHNFADIDKARRLLDFQQEIPLREGLESFCQWVIQQEKDSIGYEASLAELDAAGMLVRNDAPPPPSGAGSPV